MKPDLNARTLPWINGVRLAAEDPFGLIAVDKPAGTLSHPNRAGAIGKALLRAPYDFERQAYRLPIAEESDSVGEDGSWVYLLNRLDSATSGILLLATEEATRDAVLRAFADKRVEKVYEALVFGVVRKRSDVWRDRLSKSKSEGGVRASVGGGLTAETRLVAARQIPGIPAMSALRLMPVTGRTHQLRIQCAKRGTPIVGDRTYGDFAKNKRIAKERNVKRLCLHCAETRLEYERDGRTRRFAATSKIPF